MSFSDRQIRILRSRLRAYREESGKRERGRNFSWNLIGLLMERTLRLDFDVGGRGGDRLSKFVDGEPKKKGSKERRSIIPETRRLQAIRDFLMHPDIRFLAAYELEDGPELPAAARAFADFLEDEGGEDNPRVLSEQITGVYEYARSETDRVRNHRLSLNLLAVGLFEAEEIIEYFDTRLAVSDFSQWDQPEKYRRRHSRILCTGWAVKNKYDCLFLFLKDQGDGSFTSYIAAGIDYSSNKQVAAEWLYLQKYAPLSYFHASSVPEDYMSTFLAERLKENSLFLFERMSEFSKVSEKDKEPDVLSADRR